MTRLEALIGTAIGIAAIVIGLTSKHFYASGPGQRVTANTKRVPRWFGALWFVVLGGWACCFSLPRLRGSWQGDDRSGWVNVLAFLCFVGLIWVLRSWAQRDRKDEFPGLSLSRDAERVEDATRSTPRMDGAEE